MKRNDIVEWFCCDCGEVFGESNLETRKEDEGMQYGEELYCCPFCKSFEVDKVVVPEDKEDCDDSDCE